MGEACEVNFYTGEDALEHQRQTTALARFRAVHDSCIKDYVEYGAALAELKHKAAPAKPAVGPAKTAAGATKAAAATSTEPLPTAKMN